MKYIISALSTLLLVIIAIGLYIARLGSKIMKHLNDNTEKDE